MVEHQYENLFSGVQTDVVPEIDAVEFCKEFGWTYDQFLDAPVWFTEVARIRSRIESSVQKRATRKAKRKSRRK